MKLNLIVAMTKERIIGKDGVLPWHLKDDMKVFKEKTTNKTVIMGKNTWFSLPEKFRPLPNRNNIILSTTMKETNDAIICKSIEDALEKARDLGTDVFCIGGARLYESMLPQIDVLHISWVKKNYEGDTYFPNIDFSKWNEVESKEFGDFIYKKYIRKN
jgi:dihydrofolate reductase